MGRQARLGKDILSASRGGSRTVPIPLEGTTGHEPEADLLGLLAGLVASGLTITASPLGRDCKRSQEIRSEVYPEEAMDYMRRVYATDRWSTFPKYAETSRVSQERHDPHGPSASRDACRAG